MTLPGRRLKKYHPRRSRYLVRAQKEKMREMETTLHLNMSQLLTSIKNGSKEEIQHSTSQTKTQITNLKPAMLKLASEMKGAAAKIVQEYLQAIELLASSAPGWVDEEKIARCQRLKEKLEKLIAA